MIWLFLKTSILPCNKYVLCVFELMVLEQRWTFNVSNYNRLLTNDFFYILGGCVKFIVNLISVFNFIIINCLIGLPATNQSCQFSIILRSYSPTSLTEIPIINVEQLWKDILYSCFRILLKETSVGVRNNIHECSKIMRNSTERPQQNQLTPHSVIILSMLF